MASMSPCPNRYRTSNEVANMHVRLIQNPYRVIRISRESLAILESLEILDSPFDGLPGLELLYGILLKS